MLNWWYIKLPLVLKRLTDMSSLLGIATSLRPGRSGNRIPVRGEIFRTRPDRPGAHPVSSYTLRTGSFPGVKLPGRGINHPPTSSAEVKERVQLEL
jgi:hypothetical protein